VTRNADGTEKVVHRFITRAQQLAMAAARERNGAPATAPTEGESTGQTAEAWTLDSTCANPASQWLYDGPGQTGNQLCLLPESTSSQSFDLSSATRPVSICTPRFCRPFYLFWQGAVRSYWNPSSTAASLFTTAWFQGTDGCRTYFAADGAKHDADACVSKARYLWAGQEQVVRYDTHANLAGVSGSYFVPGSTVTVKWYATSDTSGTPRYTYKETVDASGSFTDTAWATCYGWGCGCGTTAVVVDAAGRSSSTHVPECL